MASFTVKAIKETFLKLLNEKPLNQITVKDIVEECGINRNTFYYHFEDLPTLLNEILIEDADRVIAAAHGAESLEICMDMTISMAIENKRAVMHIYNSSNREAFETYLNRLCQYTIEQYIEKTVPVLDMPDEDRRLLIKFYKCECMGQILDWLDAKMSYDIQSEFHRLCELMSGFTETAVMRSLDQKKKPSGRI